MQFLIFVLFIIISCSMVCEAKKLPKYIDVCKTKEEDVGKCIKRNIDTLMPKFRNGIPELLIPKFQPYELKYITVNLGNNLNGSLEDMKLWLNDVQPFTIEDIKVNLDDVSLYLKIRIPEVRSEFIYTVQGKVLVLTLNSHGNGSLNLTDTIAEITASGIKELRKGEEYIGIKNIDIKPKVGKLHIHLENLFPNNEELTQTSNKLFNDNQDVLIEEYVPFVINIIKDIVRSLVTNFFNNFSFKTLFPDY